MSLAGVSLVGLVLFLWPFLGLGVPQEIAALAISLAAVAALALLEVGTRRLDSGRLALLATLAAIDAALRLALVNGIAGFSPIFFLILMAGYAFGASYGFLVGSFSLLVSAIVTGGVGPWLPYEMFAAGWVGVAAGVAARLARMAGPWPGATERAASWLPRRRDLVALVAVAIVTGFAYGAFTDVWEWAAYYRGVPDIGWQPGAAPLDALARFGRFYVVTSLVWDTFRAAGDSLAVVALGTPVLMAFARLRSRSGYEILPTAPATAAPVTAGPATASGRADP